MKVLQRTFTYLVLVLPLVLAAGASYGQEAIKIGNKVKGEDNMTAGDIYSINDMIVISDTLSGWDVRWRGGLQGSQASFSNWSSGGVNAVSGTALTFFSAMYQKNRFGYVLGIDLKYGRAHLANEGGRKTDDYIAINNKFSHDFLNEHWNMFVNINLATQFSRGYDYDVPDSVGRELISGFFSPAYFNQIAGVGFTPSKHFIAEIGFALKETIVSNDSLTEQYGLDPGVNFRFEPGYSIHLGLNLKLLKNIRYKSSFETFTNIQKTRIFDPRYTIKYTSFNFTNIIIGQINKFFNLTFEFDLAYNHHFSNKLQIKEILAAGLSFKIF